MNSIHTGTWKVLTVLNLGKMQELTELIVNTQIEISETQKKKSVEMV